ncbi:MAG: sigma-70 family RNA polymerase sigma factor [Ruminococcus sp.]|nr:sigma-70 family RNA polymerase sigma factor [Ruminococcus sp.]
MKQKLYAGLSFDQVVQKYAKNVLSSCLMRTGSSPDADDCFQNVFLKLYTVAPSFRDEEHLKAWLLRVAINECKNYLRDNRRHLTLDAVRESPLPSTDDERDISWALMRLEPKYREALYLYYIERYKVAEIASILGYNPNTVKTLLSRGRQKLKKIYGGESK